MPQFIIFFHFVNKVYTIHIRVYACNAYAADIVAVNAAASAGNKNSMQSAVSFFFLGGSRKPNTTYILNLYKKKYQI